MNVLVAKPMHPIDNKIVIDRPTTHNFQVPFSISKEGKGELSRFGCKNSVSCTLTELLGRWSMFVIVVSRMTSTMARVMMVVEHTA